MSEKPRTRKLRKTLAAGVAALALMPGAVEAKAGTDRPLKPSGIETVDRKPKLPPLISIEQATNLRAHNLRSGWGANYYHGWVTYIGEDGEKHGIDNPILQLLVNLDEVDQNSPPVQYILTHPRSRYWAFGEIERGVEGNLGNDNLVLRPVKPGVKFFRDDSLLEGQEFPAAVSSAEFRKNPDGSLDLASPTFLGRPMKERNGTYRAIGLGIPLANSKSGRG